MKSNHIRSAGPLSFAAARLAARCRNFLMLARAGWAASKNRRAVAALLREDDHLLRDIGISRLDVQSALSEPLFRDASLLLAERAAQARRFDRLRAAEDLVWARSGGRDARDPSHPAAPQRPGAKRPDKRARAA